MRQLQRSDFSETALPPGVPNGSPLAESGGVSTLHRGVAHDSHQTLSASFLRWIHRETLNAFTCQESSEPVTLKGRNLMRFRNPFTDEIIETKETNNKKLIEWKSAHVRELIEAWREI